jgi:hypothetical protein
MTTARPSPKSIAAELTVPERMLLLCLAFKADWVKAGVTYASAQVAMVRGLIEREHGMTDRLTEEGRAVLDALLKRQRPS